MAIKNLITLGIGASPASISPFILLGLSTNASAVTWTEWDRLSVTIGGNDVTAYLKEEPQVFQIVNGPEIGVASMVFIYDYSTRVVALEIDEWDAVVIRVGVSSADTVVWRGYVTRKLKEPLGNPLLGKTVMTVEAQSLSVLLATNEPIVGTWNADTIGKFSDNGLVGTLINTYASALYDGSKITGGTTVMEYIGFQDETLRSALEKITALTGKEYGVDTPSGKLYYRDRASGTVTSILSDNPNYVTTFPIASNPVPVKLEDALDFRNAVKVVGGWTHSALDTDNWSGDGSTKIFDLTEKPIVIVEITLSGVVQTYGYDVVDDPADFDVLVNYDTSKIKFYVAPGSFAPIVCKYRHLVRVETTVTDTASVSAIGMTLWAPVLEDKTLSGTAIAAAAGSAYLERYAAASDSIQLSTTHAEDNGTAVIPYEPGKMIRFSVDRLDLASGNSLEIQSVSMRAEPRPGGDGYAKVFWDLSMGSYRTIGQRVSEGAQPKSGLYSQNFRPIS